MMKLKISIDLVNNDTITEFLNDHLEDMKATSPPESKHALDVYELRQSNVWFWSAYADNQLAGCVALKKLNPSHVELKSMRTSPKLRGKGIATQLLLFVIEHAAKQGFKQLSPETGSMSFFDPARKLYSKHGFSECPPFGDYTNDPNSVYMTRNIN